jgi:hypothetical protein
MPDHGTHVTKSSQSTRFPISIVVNADIDPSIPSSLSLGGEGAEHRKMGQIILEKREDGKLYINGVEATLYLSAEQMHGEITQGYKLREELKDKNVLNACIFDALFANPNLIPEDWKQDKQGRTRYIFFWGTIFRGADGRLYVRCLYWVDGRHVGIYRCLDYYWDDRGLAASLAS